MNAGSRCKGAADGGGYERSGALRYHMSVSVVLKWLGNRERAGTRHGPCQLNCEKVSFFLV